MTQTFLDETQFIGFKFPKDVEVEVSLGRRGERGYDGKDGPAGSVTSVEGIEPENSGNVTTRAVVTRAEYDLLEKDPNIMYLIKEN